MKLNLGSRFPVAAILGLFAGLNIAAAPMSPTLDGEIVVRGTVFHDANGNGRRDARERALSNVTVISQAADAQGGAVNASTVTNAEGQFEIQTRIGHRVSVVPGAGYKALQVSGVIMREGVQEIAFPLYVDKVVVDRVIRMEPAEVNIPPPQVYVSPQISVPAPVVNVQPAEVHLAPANVVVQPAPVHVSLPIDPRILISAAAVFSLTSLLCAGIIARAIRSHARAMREIAGYRASMLASQMCVNRDNWKEIAQQVIADTTGEAVTVDALVSMSCQPAPTISLRATDSRIFVFSQEKSLVFTCSRAVPLCIDLANAPASVGELSALWEYFAVFMQLPARPSRSCIWSCKVTKPCDLLSAKPRVGSVSSRLRERKVTDVSGSLNVYKPHIPNSPLTPYPLPRGYMGRLHRNLDHHADPHRRGRDGAGAELEPHGHHH